MHWLLRLLFFGNYFYGICVIALAIEANLQQGLPLNDLSFYLWISTGTILYYTYAYQSEPGNPGINERSRWYKTFNKQVYFSQIATLLLFLMGIALWLKRFPDGLWSLKVQDYLLVMVFPLAALMYYGNMAFASFTYSLRNNGWLKPFVIGFVWAGLVTIYPMLFLSAENGSSFTLGTTSLLLFLKNFMFIAVLSIMFDIKDYAADHNQQLKTFVVRIGLRKTIYYILIPLSVLGLGTFLIYAIEHKFTILRILINTLPFILLIIVAYSMHQRKSILYYLAIIDGLLLVIALCGIMGISFLN